MSYNKNMNTTFERGKGHDEWLTPPLIWKDLGHFDLDPCAPIDPPWTIADTNLNINDDGLATPWRGFVWCNPPYGKRVGLWLEKMKNHNNGIALVFVRTDTRAFQDHVLEGAKAILFIERRLRFLYVTGEEAEREAGSPSALVAYGDEAVERLKNCSIKGKLITL